MIGRRLPQPFRIASSRLAAAGVLGVVGLAALFAGCERKGSGPKNESTAGPPVTADSPADQPAPKTATPGATPAPAWNGIFLVYDRSGKESILSKTVLGRRGSETENPKITNLSVAGVSALKVERKSSVAYWAETGSYAVSSGELPVFEEILNRLRIELSTDLRAQQQRFQLGSEEQPTVR